MMEKILIVDDSLDMLEVLRRQLSDMGYATTEASNVIDAIDLLKASIPDLLITDLQMPGVDGMKLVKYVAQHYPQMPVLVITGFPSVENAVNAVQSGAMDYLIKPFSKDQLGSAVLKSILPGRGERQAKALTSEKPPKKSTVLYHGMIGQSEALQELKELIERIKDNKITVLITGESGTGKELVARAIHYSGRFAKSPFIPVNCGAIPENLLESELFGYTKGAFTGADSNRAGFFQAADGGTIFLDEIGNASASVQQRLLRVLQEKEVTMIGANRPQKIDVRVIAATNNELKKMVENGTFREDLYYRLNVIHLEIPPLRDRKSDIPVLVNYFLHKFSREFQLPKPDIAPLALEVLMQYPWPGNIRELENTMQKLLIISDDCIGAEQIPAHMKMNAPVESDTDGKWLTLQEMEKKYIQRVLFSVGNNKSKAAQILGIDRKTLREKVK
jgi:two-component system response regulator HydG